MKDPHQFYREFDTRDEAIAFAKGLEVACTGNISGLEVINASAHYWGVAWLNEDRSNDNGND